MGESDTRCLCTLPATQVYRFLPSAATYLPVTGYRSLGRFGDGNRDVIYFAQEAAGAVAEYLRRHAEFTHLQPWLKIRIFQVELSIAGYLLDVRDAGCASRAAIDHDRLTSSEPDEEVRYFECRALASRAANAGDVGIVYPSASMRTMWNLVCLGADSPGGWRASSWQEIPTPIVDGSLIQFLDPC